MTDTQRPPEFPSEFGPGFDEPPGHALSTRGYVLVAVIPFVIAAVAMSLLWWRYDPSQTIEGKNIPVLLSPWHPGSPSNDTVISGRLELGSDRCVTLRSAGGSEVTPVFPAGYVATDIGGGRINLYDTGHHLIAHGGDELRATGEVAGVGGYAGRPCAPSGDATVAVIESAVVVTR